MKLFIKHSHIQIIQSSLKRKILYVKIGEMECGIILKLVTSPFGDHIFDKPFLVGEDLKEVLKQLGRNARFINNRRIQPEID